MDLVEKIKNAGIIGAGGAGFPTYAKLAAGVECIIVNGAECEPLLRVDQELSEIYAKELVSALNTLKETLRAGKAVYALKAKYHNAVDSVSKEAAKYPNIDVALLPNIYPVGDEQVLVYEVLKRIVPEGGIPLAVGCVVINVETLLNIYNTISSGAPVTAKYITVAGAVKTPCTVKVPVGISFMETIDMCGGMISDGCTIIEGGPIMGSIICDTSAPVTKKTKGLVVLPPDHPLIAAKQRNITEMLKVARSACCHCMLCTEVCPRNLLGHTIHPDKIMRIASYGGICDSNSDITEAFLCCECGLCEMACVMNLQPWKLNRELKSKLASGGIKNPHHNTPSEVNRFREFRKFPSNKIILRNGLRDYDVPAHIDETIQSHAKAVVLNLKQSAGAPSAPGVKVGDIVKAGDLIAGIPDGALGSSLHASISGKVVSVDKKSIRIESCGE